MMDAPFTNGFDCGAHVCESACETTSVTQHASIRWIGFGGGCHWCSEAVFESLLGVPRVDQGWLAPAGSTDAFSEGVLVYFDERRIGLDTLIAIHLHTHSCTSNHALRGRYRSAIYVESSAHAREAQAAIDAAQPEFTAPIVTRVLPFGAFRGNDERYLHYWRRDHKRPFCETFISPKLHRLSERFGRYVDPERLAEPEPGPTGR